MNIDNRNRKNIKRIYSFKEMILTKQVKKANQKTPDMEINDQFFKGVGVLSWHKRNNRYYQFSPFYLKTDGKEIIPNPGDVIFENYWQGIKVYPTVTKQEIYTHYTKKGDPKFLIWKYPYQKHLSGEEEILPDYYKWREKLWKNEKAVRYLNGYQGRHRCKFALINEERVGYIESRKKVYIPEYIRLIKALPLYKELLDYVKKGGNIIIYEIDVPSHDKKGLYGKVSKGGYYKCNLKKLDKLLESQDAPFGHGLCIAQALLEDLQN